MALIDHKYVSEPATLRPMDLAAKIEFFTLDVISDVSFSAPFGFLSEDKDLFRYSEINASAVPVMNMLQAMPWLVNVVYRWPFRLALPRDEDNVGFGRLMGSASLFLWFHALLHLCRNLTCIPASPRAMSTAASSPALKLSMICSSPLSRLACRMMT